MKCPQCQHENRKEAKFCEECGTKLPLICPNCGSEVRLQAKFCDECGTSLVAKAPSTPLNVAVPKLKEMHTQLQRVIPKSLAERMHLAAQEIEGENRLVTALFADISGFTSMSQKLTPEVSVEKVNRCFQLIMDAVHRYEGSVNRFMGDCVLAFFGAPITHENDPERGILAALDMQEAVFKLELKISVGINSGMMYFGPIGTLDHLEVSAYGPDINLAKRLQEAAEPGQIFVGAGTHRFTRRAFDFQKTEKLVLKGIDEEVVAYEVLGVKDRPEKLRGIEGLRARMIGREREFADLKEVTNLWMAGQGQIVSIIGEAGIGKSRLVTELKTYLERQEEWKDGGMEEKQSDFPLSHFLWLEGRCVSIGQPISYWPFLDILRIYFGLSEGDSEQEMANKVTEMATDLFPQNVEEILPLLGNLLSIRFGNELDQKLEYATPEQIKHQTLIRLRDLFETLARKQPLLLILEDLHWADDLSLDLLSLLMDSLATTPLMLLCVHRPEQEHRIWQLSNLARRKCLDRFTEIPLKQLSSRESRQLVETLLTIDNLPENVKELILRKSEGNPFFIEEVIRSLIDRDLVYRDGDHWKAHEEISDIDVPDTIQSVVLARVDRLQAEARTVLQCASVIGRMFKYRLLEHLAQKERDLDRYLSEFEERDLVYEERTVPELEYAFKHAFTQEATYQSILERRRREFHHQVAQRIEMLYRERLEDYYEELARHYSKSGDAVKAVEYLLKAGEKAKRSYANEVAISHFQNALEMLGQQEIERKDWRLEALRGLGEVCLGIGKIAEAEKAFDEAIALAKEIGLPPRQLVRLYYWIAEALYWQSRYNEVIRYGEMGLEILENDTECLEAALINSRIATGNKYKGNLEKWREYTHKNMAFIKKLEYSVELRPPYDHIIGVAIYRDRDLETAYSWAKELEKRAEQHHDLRGLATAWRKESDILTFKGDHNNGLPLLQKSLDMFDRIGDDKHVSLSHWRIGETLFNSGNIEEAEKRVRILLKMTEQIGNTRDIAIAHLQSGRIAMCQRRWEEGISYLQKCLEREQIIGNPFWIALVHIQLGRAYLKKGDYHRALKIFEEVADSTIKIRQIYLFPSALGGVEEVHAELETRRSVTSVPAEFVNFCCSLKKQHANALKWLSLKQWYLEPVGAKHSPEKIEASSDDYKRMIRPYTSWNWIDEFGDCSYKIVEPNGLEICAANGRDLYRLNLSAPRILRSASGNFVAQTICTSVSEDKPTTGGILLWKDKKNFLRLERGTMGKYEISFRGRIGYGDRVFLRLERLGRNVNALCSADGEDWFTVGSADFPAEDPVKIGLHAIGNIDRTTYNGAYPDGTAIGFESFQLWEVDV